MVIVSQELKGRQLPSLSLMCLLRGLMCELSELMAMFHVGSHVTSFDGDAALTEEQWRRLEKRRLKQLKKNLKSGFASLPTPKKFDVSRMVISDIIMPVIDHEDPNEVMCVCVCFSRSTRLFLCVMVVLLNRILMEICA